MPVPDSLDATTLELELLRNLMLRLKLRDPGQLCALVHEVLDYDQLMLSWESMSMSEQSLATAFGDLDQPSPYDEA